MTPAGSEKLRQALTRRWATAEAREVLMAGRQRVYRTPRYRAAQAERTRKQWENPEYREKMIRRMKETWQDPAFREFMFRRQREGLMGTNKRTGRPMKFKPFETETHILLPTAMAPAAVVVVRPRIAPLRLDDNATLLTLLYQHHPVAA